MSSRCASKIEMHPLKTQVFKNLVSFCISKWTHSTWSTSTNVPDSLRTNKGNDRETVNSFDWLLPGGPICSSEPTMIDCTCRLHCQRMKMAHFVARSICIFSGERMINAVSSLNQSKIGVNWRMSAKYGLSGVYHQVKIAVIKIRGCSQTSFVNLVPN